jgi:hypothetical protein
VCCAVTITPQQLQQQHVPRSVNTQTAVEQPLSNILTALVFLLLLVVAVVVYLSLYNWADDDKFLSAHRHHTNKTNKQSPTAAAVAQL